MLVVKPRFGCCSITAVWSLSASTSGKKKVVNPKSISASSPTASEAPGPRRVSPDKKKSKIIQEVELKTETFADVYLYSLTY